MALYTSGARSLCNTIENEQINTNVTFRAEPTKLYYIKTARIGTGSFGWRIFDSIRTAKSSWYWMDQNLLVQLANFWSNHILRNRAFLTSIFGISMRSALLGWEARFWGFGPRFWPECFGFILGGGAWQPTRMWDCQFNRVLNTLSRIFIIIWSVGFSKLFFWFYFTQWQDK